MREPEGDTKSRNSVGTARPNKLDLHRERLAPAALRVRQWMQLTYICAYNEVRTRYLVCEGLSLFEEEQLFGGFERSIVLETHLGRSIPNSIEPEPGERERRVYDLLRNKCGQLWMNRKRPCGTYNCFGMVFASRRTAILDDGQIPQIPLILQDDGYRQVTEAEALSGDLVLYKNRETAQFWHVALIMRRETEMIGQPLFALSKWNSTAGEDEHPIRNHCWAHIRELNEIIELEFWTDR